MNKPYCDKELNAYVVDEEEGIKRIAEVSDWKKVVDCELLYTLFGTPVCGFFSSRMKTQVHFSNTANYRLCHICIKDNIACPLYYVEGMKTVEMEDLV